MSETKNKGLMDLSLGDKVVLWKNQWGVAPEVTTVLRVTLRHIVVASLPHLKFRRSSGVAVGDSVPPAFIEIPTETNMAAVTRATQINRARGQARQIVRFLEDPPKDCALDKLIAIRNHLDQAIQAIQSTATNEAT